MYPIGSSRRRWLNQSTHSSVASSTASQVFQVLRWITSALNRPLINDDQLTSYNGVPYTYAADGSLASAGSTTYQYDALGHLLAVHQAEISTFKWPRILGQPHEQGGGEDCRPQQGYA